jgi:ABC-type sugar transport system substrate-binding protein
MRRTNATSRSTGPRTRRLTRFVMAGLAILAGGVLLAACGGSSNRAAGGASSSASIRDSVNATSCVTQVAALVKQEQAPMPDITPTTKVKMSKLKGKTVWYISPDQATGYALSVSQGLSAAGQAAGVKIQIFDGKDEPTLFASGMQEAVAQHAAAIFLYGFNPALVPQGLLAAKKAHIPVITALTGVGAPSNGTVFEAINENVRQEGVSMADFAAYHTGCKVNGATSYDPLYPSLVTERHLGRRSRASCSGPPA